MAKYKEGTYHRGYFCGGSNIYLNLITCEDNIVIPPILKIYVLCWYYVYLLNPGINRTEEIFLQNVYRTRIRKNIWKEVTNCDTCQCKRLTNKNYGKLPAKEAE